MADGIENENRPVENEKQKLLYAAIVKAQGMAHGVEKDARNGHHGYNYVSAEMMIREAKEILVACELALVPGEFTLYPPVEPGGDKGDAGWTKNSRSAATLGSVWMLVHKLGGSLRIEGSWPVAPENGRPIDKAVAAARTASLSYLLRDLLQIPRVEEGTDLDGNDRDQHHADHAKPSSASPARARISKALDDLEIVGDVQRRNAVVSVLKHEPTTDMEEVAVAEALESRAAKHRAAKH